MLVLIAMLVANLRIPTPGTTANRPPDGNPSENEDQVLATIGDTQITESQLQQKLIKKYGKELLNEMLDQLAVEMEAKAVGLTVSEADIAQELKKMQLGYDSEEAFYKAMAELGLDREELQRDTYYKLLTERLATRGISISDEAVDRYIAAHPEEFANYTQLRLQQIVTDNETHAKQVIERLKQGVSFEELARDMSIDDATRADGGDLGWIEENDPFVDPRILDAARTMKPGEISGAIPLDSGHYAVIRLNARKDVSKEIGRQIRESVRRQLALQEAPSVQDLLSRLREKYQAKIVSPSFG
jgi:foldase protein PrsA